MEEFIQSWGYLGVFVGILATGLGFPMPEELPIILGGVLTTHNEVRWYFMLPVCIVGVIIGDSFLYLIGRFWGTKLVEMPFIRNKLLTPERLTEISENFKKHGVKILLFARLTPGIRAPIFLTAGITRLPLTYFLVADGIYAIPGVSILFFLGYWFTDAIIDIVKDAAMVKPILVLVALAGVILYFLYHFWKKPVVTGNPTEMPPIVGPMTERLEGVAEKMAERVAERVTETFHRTPAPKPECAAPAPTPPPNLIGRGLPPRVRKAATSAGKRARRIVARVRAKPLHVGKKKSAPPANGQPHKLASATPKPLFTPASKNRRTHESRQARKYKSRKLEYANGRQ